MGYISSAMSELVWYCQTDQYLVIFLLLFSGISLWMQRFSLEGYRASFATTYIGKQHPKNCKAEAAQSGWCWSLGKRLVKHHQPVGPNQHAVKNELPAPLDCSFFLIMQSPHSGWSFSLHLVCSRNSQLKQQEHSPTRWAHQKDLKNWCEISTSLNSEASN